MAGAGQGSGGAGSSSEGAVRTLDRFGANPKWSKYPGLHEVCEGKRLCYYCYQPIPQAMWATAHTDACPMALDPRRCVSSDMEVCIGFPVSENKFARLSVENPTQVEQVFSLNPASDPVVSLPRCVPSVQVENSMPLTIEQMTLAQVTAACDEIVAKDPPVSDSPVVTQVDSASQVHQRSKSPKVPRIPKSAAPSTDDRMLLPRYFQQVERQIQRQFTLDACANPSGDNALVPGNFCSTERSFLKEQLTDQCVWINPPFTQVYDFVDYYVKQKAEHPQLSACILVPKWGRPQHTGLKRMQLVKQFSASTRLFTKPNPDGTRTLMNGVPWPILVYYDLPRAPSMYHCPKTGSALTFQFPGKVSQVPATLLVDTGCSGAHYLSASFCKRIGLSYKVPVVDPTEFSDAGQSVTLHNGSTLDALGRVSVPVHCQGYKETLECVVLDLDASCDLILGDPWLHRHQAVLDFAQGSLSFRFKDRLVQLTPPKGASASPAVSPRLLSIQAVRRAARHQRPMFMVYLRRGSPGTAPSEGEVSLDAQAFVDPPLSGSDSNSGSESVAPVLASALSPVGVGRQSPSPHYLD